MIKTLSIDEKIYIVVPLTRQTTDILQIYIKANYVLNKKNSDPLIYKLLKARDDFTFTDFFINLKKQYPSIYFKRNGEGFGELIFEDNKEAMLFLLTLE